jgi:hypothetical protein
LTAKTPVPLLVVVTGPEAAGNATIARSLADQVGLPLLGKDAIKDALSDTIGFGDRRTSREIGTAAFALLFDVTERLLRAGGSCVLEVSLAVGTAEEWFARLPPCTVLRVLVTTPDELVLEQDVAGPSPSSSSHVAVDEVATIVRASLQAIYAP